MQTPRFTIRLADYRRKAIEAEMAKGRARKLSDWINAAIDEKLRGDGRTS